MFSDFSLKFSHYTVLEAKCVGNWKSEILWWAHYLVRNKKIVKFCVYRPCSLDMRRAYASHAPPPPARPPTPPPGPSPPPRNTWPRHIGPTWEKGRLVDGVGEGESPVHAPRFPYRLGINGTVWGFGLNSPPPHCVKQCVAGKGWGILSPVGDHSLQEFETWYLTRLRTYKIARPPQAKTLEGRGLQTNKHLPQSPLAG